MAIMATITSTSFHIMEGEVNIPRKTLITVENFTINNGIFLLRNLTQTSQ